MRSVIVLAIAVTAPLCGFGQAPVAPERPRFFPEGSAPKPLPRFFPGEAAPTPASTAPQLRPLVNGQPPAITQTGFMPQPEATPQAMATSETPAESGGAPRPNPNIRLPLTENLLTVDPSSFTLRRQYGSWQLYAGALPLHDFGDDRETADEAVRCIRGLHPTRWGRIGTPKPVVEYGLVDGEPSKWTLTPKVWMPFDLNGLNTEQVRGAWVVRDGEKILLNFGTSRDDADQAVAVAKRYGFNRLGFAGFPRPAFAFFFAGPSVIGADNGNDPLAALVRTAQERDLARTGVDVPGLGYVGERLVIDSRKVEARKDRNEWVLAHGGDVLARFGYGELTARDALKAVQAGRFTEFCRVGGLTFFLVNSSAPDRVPFGVIGRPFNVDRLRIANLGVGRWDVLDSGNRVLASCSTKDEAEQAAHVLRAFRFDTDCQIGSGDHAMRFFVRQGR